MKYILIAFLLFTSNLYAQNNLADSVKNELVQRHNYYREQVKVPKIKWSDKLAQKAQDWAIVIAKKDRLIHSNYKYGENIFMSTGAVSPKFVVDDWASEKKYYHGEKISSKNYHLFGHYTQIIWSSTIYVGCAEAISKTGKYYWVCEYDPPGNYIGEKPF
jgi:pathogenesis-related protein 1